LPEPKLPEEFPPGHVYCVLASMCVLSLIDCLLKLLKQHTFVVVDYGYRLYVYDCHHNPQQQQHQHVGDNNNNNNKNNKTIHNKNNNKNKNKNSNDDNNSNRAGQFV
jgi:hypothetical protein